MKKLNNSESDVLNAVHRQYASVAKSELTNDSAAVRSVAAAFGYTEDDLASLPPEANMGLSCGNPLALAGVALGEVVLDLGCGGGMDVVLAAQKVGPTGKVIGVDMTAEMLDRARAGSARLGLTNVEFHQTKIDQLPLSDNTVDCVISNCVINLVPDKAAVFREIRRVLKPGGRVAISDIALKQPLPENVKESIEAYVGCISGAILIDDYRQLLQDAGFNAVVVTDTGADLNAYTEAGSSGCCGTISESSSSSSVHDGLTEVMKSFDANAFAASVRVHAVKPLQVSISDPGTEVPIQEIPTKTIQIYDKPMCCSTGVCGPQVDSVLPRFAADLDWLKSQGHQVERYNLAQQPQSFIENTTVHEALKSEGDDCLPLILVDGEIVSRADYPTRERLATWANDVAVKPLLPIAQGGGCCGSTGCC